MSVQRGPQGNAHIQIRQQNFEISAPKFEIIPYFCGVNPVVAYYTSYNCFHGAEPQFNRRINYSIFYYDHQLHQTACSIIAG